MDAPRCSRVDFTLELIVGCLLLRRVAMLGLAKEHIL
jgi:hypothetical protein